MMVCANPKSMITMTSETKKESRKLTSELIRKSVKRDLKVLSGVKF